MLWHACFGLALTVMALQGQTISFFRQFETSGMDRATAVAADGSGIYVIGNRGFSQGGGVRKYDSRGSELRTREFSVPAESVHFAGRQPTPPASTWPGIFALIIGSHWTVFQVTMALR